MLTTQMQFCDLMLLCFFFVFLGSPGSFLLLWLHHLNCMHTILHHRTAWNKNHSGDNYKKHQLHSMQRYANWHVLLQPASLMHTCWRWIQVGCTKTLHLRITSDYLFEHIHLGRVAPVAHKSLLNLECKIHTRGFVSTLSQV